MFLESIPHGQNFIKVKKMDVFYIAVNDNFLFILRNKNAYNFDKNYDYRYWK